MANYAYSPNRSVGIPQYEFSLRVLPERGGPVAWSVDGEREVMQVRPRHILLLVHGFNNTASDAKDSYSLFLRNAMPFLKRLRNGPDAIVCLQWPGDEVVIERATAFDAIGYPIDIARARISATRLAASLRRIASLYSPRDPLLVSAIGHSLGCRLLLETLTEVASIKTDRLRFELLSLMAAAVPVGFVDGNNLDPDLLPGGKQPRVLLKLHSVLDMALALAFPAGESLGVTQRTESPSYFRKPEAVGRHGKPDVLGSKINTLDTANGHSEYWSDKRSVLFAIPRFENPSSRPIPERHSPPARKLPLQQSIGSRYIPKRNPWS